MSVYLDYNASAPILPEVLQAMIEAYQETPGNADSRTHIYGTKAGKLVLRSREIIAKSMGVDPSELFFTSGSTESNNTCLLGIREYALKTGKKHIITTAIEHMSVLEPLRHLEVEGFHIDYIRPDESGRIKTDQVLNLIRDDTVLVSCMYVNSETGIIQPVEEIGTELQKKGILFHIDATQALGKLNHRIRNLSYNMMSVSSHKIGGPQGIGAMILKWDSDYKRPPISQLMYGGHQERSFRPGTTPVALVAGFAKAAEISDQHESERYESCRKIKEDFLKAIAGFPFQINGDPAFCLPSTINISIDGLDAEAAFLILGDHYSFSNGSACNSSSHTLSYVLEAMGLDEKRRSEAIRLSWNGEQSIDFTDFVNTVRSVL